jgi:hypothetical protein
LGALSVSTHPALGSSFVGALPASSSSAVNMASVRTHVSVMLNLKASNFTKWRMLICVLLAKYDHVNTVTTVDARTLE